MNGGGGDVYDVKDADDVDDLVFCSDFCECGIIIQQVYCYVLFQITLEYASCLLFLCLIR